MAASTASSEQRFVLSDVDWDLYECFLNRVGDQNILISYDRGTLELMRPSWKHNRRSFRVDLLVSMLAEHFEIPHDAGGSTTFRREDQEVGLEPDQCFYAQNVDRVRGKDEIDLAVDPPPDLAIEIEISRRLAGREQIYARLGVPEIWRDDGQEVRVLLLGKDGRYQPSDRSAAFPKIQARHLSHLLSLSNDTDSLAWGHAVRAWMQQNLPQ